MSRRASASAGPETLAREIAELGQRIRQMREQLDLDQTDCALSLGVQPSVWSRWETAKREPDALVMARWCSLTGGSMDFLYLGLLGGIPNPTLALRLAQLNPKAARAQFAAVTRTATRRGRPAKSFQAAA